MNTLRRVDDFRLGIFDSEGEFRYSIPASEPARNWAGYETGRTWGEEFEAGTLCVGQEEDGSNVGAVWVQPQ